MNHDEAVAALLGGASGAAEALIECGVDCDDTELVATFVEQMGKCHTIFVEMAKAAAVPPEAMHDVIVRSMQFSPAFTNPWFLWRLAAAFRAMASAEVLEAAREAASAHEEWRVLRGHPSALACHEKLDGRMAKLAAVLPKEAGK